MVVGILAFWFTEVGGLFDMVEVIIVVFGGFILPISLMPDFLKNLASYLPFSYMVYYPVFALMGKFKLLQLLEIILIQIFWILLLVTFYKILWIKGVKKFTGVGQ